MMSGKDFLQSYIHVNVIDFDIAPLQSSSSKVMSSASRQPLIERLQLKSSARLTHSDVSALMARVAKLT